MPLLSAYGDARQGQLFGAAWALSSLRQLVDAEAASATYFELSGARGLVGTPGDWTSTEPVPVPVPVYRVLEAVLSWAEANLVRVGAVHGEVVGLGAEWPDRSELLIANLGQDEQRIELSGLSGRLTEIAELSPGSSQGPKWKGAEWKEVVPPASGSLKPGAEELTLAPYGVTRVRTA